MKKTEQEYTIGQSRVIVRIGDLLDSDVDVIVSSDDDNLTMSGGVSHAILRNGGQAIRDEAQAYLAKLGKKPDLGDVVQTASGSLKYLKVLHAISRFDSKLPLTDFETTRNVIQRAVTTSLKMLDSLGAKRIAFPAIGAGYARKPPEDVATAFADTLGPLLRKSKDSLHVEIVLFPGDMPQDVGYQNFFRKFDEQAKWRDLVVRDHAVAMIHGIRTPASWHETVGKLLREADHAIDPISVRYGYFDLISFLVPVCLIRRLYVRRIAEQLTALAASPSTKRLTIIAHSFGTYLTAHALLRAASVNVDCLILCGSVLPAGFRWDSLASRLRVIDKTDHPNVRVLNDCGWRDIWPVFAHTVTWGYGSGGRFGFGSIVVKNRFHNLSHSEFFKSPFVEKYWIPAILEGRIVPQDVPQPGGFWVWLLSILTVYHLKYFILAGLAYWALRCFT